MADVKGTPFKDIYKVKQGEFYYGLEGDDVITLEKGAIAEGGPGNDSISVPADFNIYDAIICYWTAINPILVDLEKGYALDGLGYRDTLVNVHNVHGFKQPGDKGYGSSGNDHFFIGPWIFKEGKIEIDGRSGLDSVEIAIIKDRNQGELILSVSTDGRKVIAYQSNFPGYIFELTNIESISTWNSEAQQRVEYDLLSLIDTSKIGQDTLLRGYKGWKSDYASKLTSLTYSFLDQPVSGYEGGADFFTFTATQQQTVRDLLFVLQKQTGLSFIEVAGETGQIRFGINQQLNTRGYSFIPDEFKDDQRAGDVWLDKETAELLRPGEEGYYVLLHELAHALGLQHPLPETDNSGATVLLDSISSISNTVMLDVGGESVNNSWPTWFGNFDLQALRFLYGYKPYAVTNDTYFVSDASPNLSIIDEGGLDCIDASTAGNSARIDLRGGKLSSIGLSLDGVAKVNNISISTGSSIENVIGTIFDDRITCNQLNNFITYIGGNDIVDGQDGIDTVRFWNTKVEFISAYDINTGYWNLQARNNLSGSIELRKIERLVFSDTALALDTGQTQNASITAKILGAVFGKESVKNKAYVGVGLNFLDTGWTYDNLAALALDAAGAKTNDQIVSLLWTNVIGTKPTEADKQPYIALLENGMTAGALTRLAADSSFNTTNINLIGLAETGIEYIPVS
jgi:serralysin